MMWSVAAQSKQAEAAVKLVSYFVADIEAGKVLGVERGVPPSSAVRNVVTPMLDDLGRAMADYISLVSDRLGRCHPRHTGRRRDPERAAARQ